MEVSHPLQIWACLLSIDATVSSHASTLSRNPWISIGAKIWKKQLLSKGYLAWVIMVFVMSSAILFIGKNHRNSNMYCSEIGNHNNNKIVLIGNSNIGGDDS